MAELINTWELILSGMQGLGMVLVAFIKPFFTTPLIIFPFFGFLGFWAKRRI